MVCIRDDPRYRLLQFEVIIFLNLRIEEIYGYFSFYLERMAQQLS